ncbi:MAG: hypothetical protein JNL11_03875 [Bdellovibrionaceae bacterium]|nr:hypothetical protein [Pseudobdellovibrionaceae bacterium]
MSNLRLVVLDYALKHIQNQATRQALNDLVVMKQVNFQRTDPNYVVTDKHDIIGTHYLVYDTSDLYEPKVVFALRTTYGDRSQQHRLNTPFQDLLPKISDRLQTAYQDFYKTRPVVVDCNSWCVDPQFSKKSSGLKLADIGYAMVFLHLTRMGHNHFIGCTNERYRASRWLESVGSYTRGYEFVHPVVPDPHMMIMIEKFDEAHMKTVYEENKELFDQLYDLVPENSPYSDMPMAIQQIFYGARLGKAA